jgi:hypothetical protein
VSPEAEPDSAPGAVPEPSPTPAPGRIERLLGRHPALGRLFPFVMFVSGFVWDSLTLNRIDHLLDNLVLAGYLVLFAALAVLIVRAQAGALRSPRLRRIERHFRWVLQFFLGGLLAKYVVFYFRSASWTRTSVFLLLLVVLLVGNEFLEHRLENPRLLAVLFCFCLLSFLSFALPVLVERIGTDLFLTAGAISLVTSLAVFAAAFPPGAAWGRSFGAAAALIAITWLTVTLLYFANLIPPVPLALRSAGIFHRVARVAGGYEVGYVPPPAYRFWRSWDDPFQLADGEAVYCYSAVFAPGGVRIPVQHRWSRRDPTLGWVDTDTIRFPISGGREGGFRGYTAKRAVTPGRWRVTLETEGGRILGSIDFGVVPVRGEHPPLITRLIP